MFFCIFLHFTATEYRTQKHPATPLHAYEPRITRIDNRYEKIQNYRPKYEKTAFVFRRNRTFCAGRQSAYDDME